MSFKVADGSTLRIGSWKSGNDRTGKPAIMLVVNVKCPVCGTEVVPDKLVSVMAWQEVGLGEKLHGDALVTDCCYAIVAMNPDFKQWFEYQAGAFKYYNSHGNPDKVTSPIDSRGHMVCDLR